jgi:hypothetical protein
METGSQRVEVVAVGIVEGHVYGVPAATLQSA